MKRHIRCVILRPMSAELEASARAFKRAQAALEKARAKIQREIVKANREGVRQSEIVRKTGYTREHVRRIVDSAKDE